MYILLKDGKGNLHIRAIFYIILAGLSKDVFTFYEREVMGIFFFSIYSTIYIGNKVHISLVPRIVFIHKFNSIEKSIPGDL